MIRLDRIGSRYGQLPSDVAGFARGSWEGWIVNVCAEQVGDEYRAAQVRRVKPMAVVQVG